MKPSDRLRLAVLSVVAAAATGSMAYPGTLEQSKAVQACYNGCSGGVCTQGSTCSDFRNCDPGTRNTSCTLVGMCC